MKILLLENQNHIFLYSSVKGLQPAISLAVNSLPRFLGILDTDYDVRNS